MKFSADISTCENGRDKILSVCQSGADGTRHEVIIQRGPKEFDFIEEFPGPRISCNDLGLDLVLGPNAITFSGSIMTIVLSTPENIEVDISQLPRVERRALKKVAKELFK